MSCTISYYYILSLCFHVLSMGLKDPKYLYLYLYLYYCINSTFIYIHIYNFIPFVYDNNKINK